MKNRVLTSLVVKEFCQVLRDKRVLAVLVVPPAIQLLAYGMALSPAVNNLRLGVVDFVNSPQSRELVAQLVSNHVFDIVPSGRTVKQLYSRVDSGDLEVGLVVPPEFSRQLAAKQTA